MSLLNAMQYVFRGATSLADALGNNTVLRHLDLTLNEIGSDGKDALLDAMDFTSWRCVCVRCLLSPAAASYRFYFRRFRSRADLSALAARPWARSTCWRSSRACTRGWAAKASCKASWRSRPTPSRGSPPHRCSSPSLDLSP